MDRVRYVMHYYFSLCIVVMFHVQRFQLPLRLVYFLKLTVANSLTVVLSEFLILFENTSYTPVESVLACLSLNDQNISESFAQAAAVAAVDL